MYNKYNKTFSVMVFFNNGQSNEFDDVERIDYNFLKDRAVRICRKSTDGKRRYRIFFKESVESIEVIMGKTNDPGNKNYNEPIQNGSDQDNEEGN